MSTSTLNGYRHTQMDQYTTNTQRPLTKTEIMAVAPSVYATQPYHKTSDRFGFAPTSEDIDILASMNWLVTSAMQAKSRIEGKGDFTKHLLRFRHADDFANPSPNMSEIILANGHDGTCQRFLMGGVFRIVCANGLISQDQSHGANKIRHIKSDDFAQRVIDATYEIVETMPQTQKQLATWQEIPLGPKEQEAFAIGAMALRESESQLNPRSFLRSHRTEDNAAGDGSRSIWTTLNTIQENMMTGGIQGVSANKMPNGRPRKTRTKAVKGVDSTISINRGLWAMAEALEKLKN